MDNNKLIYAVDDEAPIRELYQCALENASFDIECFSDGTELFKALKSKTPDLILLDIMLEGESGFEILQKIKEDDLYKDIPIIMVSAKGEEISKVKGLNMGADDYIAKPFGVMELVARINANLRKTTRVNKLEDTSAFKDICFDEVSHQCLINSVKVTLTLKEYSLLKLLVDNPNQALKKDFIFLKVWGSEFIGESRTLDIHITALRKILKSCSSSGEIKTIRGVGYILQ